MKEVAFLRQNAARWKQFESMLDKPRRGAAQSGRTDPDALADLFIQLTDDLSYARTFYPHSKTTQYLNALAARAHGLIYRNKKEDRTRFVAFWRAELPRLLGSVRREMLWAFLVFAGALGIGAISAGNDDTFVRLLLGDRYVNMTIANIEDDDPFKVYKQAHQLDMFLGITFNNVRVAFFAFVAGVLVSAGTIAVLFYNGVMLGAFHYLFHQHGLLLPSLLTVWIHGALEISAIILAGTAGVVMGNSILFPGTFTRRESFRRGALRGLQIAVGTVPVFIVAAFLEGFVTRLTSLPAVIKLAVIVVSVLVIAGYFIIYPAMLGRRQVE